MKRRIGVVFFSLVLLPAIAVPLQAQTGAAFVDPQAAEKANPHEDELYRAGNDALKDDKYDTAVAQFDQVAKMRGRRAAAALYWKAVALKKAGNKTEALATVAELKKDYPQSTYLKDARVLEVEMQGGAASPENVSSDEEKLLALQAVMQNDPEKGLGFAEKWIHSATISAKVKERLLFILSQSDSEKAAQVMLSIAKDTNDPDLQKRAIRYLGMNGNSRNRAALKEIYLSSSSVTVKKAVFQGWMMCGDKDSVVAVAREEKSPELRKEAIHYLGIMGARSELKQLYNANDDAATKEALLQAMGVGGDVQGMIEIAQTEKDPEVRRRAVRNLGVFGGHEGSAALVSIYESQSDLETKKEVINALFISGAAKQMVALARKETNPELKKALVQKMALMSSPEITEYMMEILSK
jgi:HEAT repeat protein